MKNPLYVNRGIPVIKEDQQSRAYRPIVQNAKQ